MPGNTLNLTLVTSHETTNLHWFLRPAGSPRPILLQPGTHVSLTSSPGLAVLSIFNISHKWAGSQPALPLISSLLSLPLLSVLLPSPPPSPYPHTHLAFPFLPPLSFLLFFSPLLFPFIFPFTHSGETKAQGPTGEWVSISAENRRLFFFTMLQWKRAVQKGHLLVENRFTLGFEAPRC